MLEYQSLLVIIPVRPARKVLSKGSLMYWKGAQTHAVMLLCLCMSLHVGWMLAGDSVEA